MYPTRNVGSKHIHIVSDVLCSKKEEFLASVKTCDHCQLFHGIVWELLHSFIRQMLETAMNQGQVPMSVRNLHSSEVYIEMLARLIPMVNQRTSFMASCKLGSVSVLSFLTEAWGPKDHLLGSPSCFLSLPIWAAELCQFPWTGSEWVSVFALLLFHSVLELETSRFLRNPTHLPGRWEHWALSEVSHSARVPCLLNLLYWTTLLYSGHCLVLLIFPFHALDIFAYTYCLLGNVMKITLIIY